MRIELIRQSTAPPDRTVVLDRWSPDSRIVVDELPATIGRSAEAGIPLADRWVSRAHCAIEEVDGRLIVRDLGSRHGTFVNGRRIARSELRPGDSITVGTSQFLVHYQPNGREPARVNGSRTALRLFGLW